MKTKTGTLLPAEVAADMRISTYTALEHIRTGRIKGGFQLVDGGPWRVDAATYEAWKAEKAVERDPNRIAPRHEKSKAAQSRRSA